jgi:hypothetical protein
VLFRSVKYSVFGGSQEFLSSVEFGGIFSPRDGDCQGKKEKNMLGRN